MDVLWQFWQTGGPPYNGVSRLTSSRYLLGKAIASMDGAMSLECGVEWDVISIRALGFEISNIGALDMRLATYILMTLIARCGILRWICGSHRSSVGVVGSARTSAGRCISRGSGSSSGSRLAEQAEHPC